MDPEGQSSLVGAAILASLATLSSFKLARFNRLAFFTCLLLGALFCFRKGTSASSVW